LEDGGNLIEVTNTRHAGRTAHLAGRAMMKGQCTLSFDLDSKPYLATPNIRFGTRGVFRMFTSRLGTSYIDVPASIASVSYRSAVESELQWTVSWVENVVQATGLVDVAYV